VNIGGIDADVRDAGNGRAGRLFLRGERKGDESGSEGKSDAFHETPLKLWCDRDFILRRWPRSNVIMDVVRGAAQCTRSSRASAWV